MRLSLETLNNNIEKLQFKASKNAPLIMTVAGIGGLVCTAVLAYRAKKHVEVIVEDIEEKRANGEDVNVAHTVLQVGGALAPTIIVGGLSIASIFGSYHVLNHRNELLATAFSTVVRENRNFKEYIKRHHPEVLTAPVEEQEEVLAGPEEVGKKKPKTVAVVKPKEIQTLEGVWFDTSEEYAKDNLNYNQMWITSRAHLLSNKLYDRGYITLNDVYSALSIPQTEANYRVGAIVGWTDSDYFDLEQEVIMIKGEDGFPQPSIYVSWPQVKSIYNKADYSSDLKDYAY